MRALEASFDFVLDEVRAELSGPDYFYFALLLVGDFDRCFSMTFSKA